MLPENVNNHLIFYKAGKWSLITTIIYIILIIGHAAQKG